MQSVECLTDSLQQKFYRHQKYDKKIDSLHDFNYNGRTIFTDYFLSLLLNITAFYHIGFNIVKVFFDQTYGCRAPWEDLADWVIDSYPWNKVTSKPVLLRLRPEDVGYEAKETPSGEITTKSERQTEV